LNIFDSRKRLNEPIITNETYHEIGENFIEVTSSTLELPEYPDFTIKVNPNPFVDYTNFVLENAPTGKKTFRLYTANGVLLKEDYFSNEVYQFVREQQLQGMYFYTIYQEDQLLGSGKVVVY